MKDKGFSGVWKLNLERSNIPPITKSQILTIETDGNIVNMREELINEKEECLIISFEGKFNGIDYPVKGTPFADTESYRLLSPNIMEGIAKKEGKICVRETAVLSDSGDIVNVTYLSYDAEGNILTSYGVFERQKSH